MSTSTELPEVMTAEEVAKFLRVNVKTVYESVKAKMTALVPMTAEPNCGRTWGATPWPGNRGWIAG